MSIFPKNNTDMVACAILIDCSGSMEAEIAPGFSRINALAAGLDVLAQEMKSDPTVRNAVEVSLIDFGGERPHGPSLLQDWIVARDFVPPKIRANGSTPLGEALLMALDQVRERKAEYRNQGTTYCRPWIIVISDGQPTDSEAKWNEAINAARHAISSKEALILSVGVDGCPLDKLSQLSTYPARPLSSHRFSEFFLWLSASMGATSQSGDSVEQLASTDPWSKR